MINSLQFIEGFPLELPAVGNKVFNFKKGINILYAGNGAGKSVILKTLQAYCAIKNGGWTQPSVPNEIGIGRMNGGDYPHCYSTTAPGKAKAVVTWDGSPSFYNDGDCKLNKLSYFYNFEDFDDGITEDDDVESFLKNTPSSGQYRASKMNKIINMVKAGAPEYTETDFGNFKGKDDKIYSKREFQYWTHINKLYKETFGDGQNTILLDEPERSLSHARQRNLFLNVLPQQLGDYQTIIATHSIYSIFTPNANVVELEEGYVDGLKDAIKETGQLLNGETLTDQMELEL